MRVKFLDTVEFSTYATEDNEHGLPVVRQQVHQYKDGDVADIDDKAAERLITAGHASEDMDAPTRMDRIKADPELGENPADGTE